jgi:hypothetical protein
MPFKILDCFFIIFILMPMPIAAISDLKWLLEDGISSPFKKNS